MGFCGGVCSFVCPPGLPWFCVIYHGWLLGLIFVQVAAEPSYLMLSNTNKNILAIIEESSRQRKWRLSTAQHLLPFSCFSRTAIQKYLTTGWQKRQVFWKELFSEISADNTLKIQQSRNGIPGFTLHSVSSSTANAVSDFNSNFQYCLASPWLSSITRTSQTPDLQGLVSLSNYMF